MSDGKTNLGQDLKEAAAELEKLRQESDEVIREILQRLGGILIIKVPAWLKIGWEFCDRRFHDTHKATGRRILFQGPGENVWASPQDDGNFFPHAIPWATFREMCGNKWPEMLLAPIQKKIEQEQAALTGLNEKKQQTDDIKKAGRGGLFVI